MPHEYGRYIWCVTWWSGVRGKARESTFESVLKTDASASPPYSRPSSSPTREKSGSTTKSNDDNGGPGEPKDKNEGLSGQILALAIPALVALSVDPLMSAVDTAYIGRLGADLGGGTVRAWLSVCSLLWVCVYLCLVCALASTELCKRPSKPRMAPAK